MTHPPPKTYLSLIELWETHTVHINNNRHSCQIFSITEGWVQQHMWESDGEERSAASVQGGEGCVAMMSWEVFRQLIHCTGIFPAPCKPPPVLSQSEARHDLIPPPNAVIHSQSDPPHLAPPDAIIQEQRWINSSQSSCKTATNSLVHWQEPLVNSISIYIVHVQAQSFWKHMNCTLKKMLHRPLL